MREVGSIVVGVAVGLAWMAIWTRLLQAFGIAPIQRKVENDGSRRERLKLLGKLKYVLIFGMLGSGFAFGLAMITIDLVNHRSDGWLSELIKFVFLAVCFGVFQSLWGWHRVFRDPVPFPTNYPPSK